MKTLTPIDSEIRSTDVLAADARRVREGFPQAFAEEAIDVLKQIQGGARYKRPQSSGLNWYGKHRAAQRGRMPSRLHVAALPRGQVRENSEVEVGSCI